jgi:hypothetical protein
MCVAHTRSFGSVDNIPASSMHRRTDKQIDPPFDSIDDIFSSSKRRRIDERIDPPFVSADPDSAHLFVSSSRPDAFSLLWSAIAERGEEVESV